MLEVQTIKGPVYLLEDLTHVVDIDVDGSKKIVIASGDDNDENWGVAWLSSEKMLKFFDLDVGGNHWIKSSKLELIYQKFQRGKSVYMPVMYNACTSKCEPSIMDGRHRTKALHELGVNKIPVMVPQCQILYFEKEFA